MNQRQFNGETERFVRRYDYDDTTVLAADLDIDEEDVYVDTVDDTAIVVLQREDGDEEFEIDLPGTAANIDTQNGVLTITITQ
ncbi:Hsp20/alpha crystallin family protein [Halorarum halophilum]|uniref:Hsp20/alpha crystallin family protein n=1 Tax=Halorarum halophilum TaxID=2743090 RepID=A0A7D5KCG6_9EURY|nr:Hsp20/alpha crystallin family protein [Halobaculum halophilum]QLG26617.1 Hsp20/alpha crystallin family protein [Halobaculum halophilum]